MIRNRVIEQSEILTNSIESIYDYMVFYQNNRFFVDYKYIEDSGKINNPVYFSNNFDENYINSNTITTIYLLETKIKNELEQIIPVNHSTDSKSLYYEKLCIWGNEIILLNYSIPIYSYATIDNIYHTFIQFEILERGMYGTEISKHYAGEMIRSVIDISEYVININIKNQSNTIQSTLFSPNVSTHDITLIDDIKKWSPFSSDIDRKYETKNNAIYFFECKNNCSLLQATGFLNNISFDYNQNQITLEFQDKYKFFIDKIMDKTIIFENIDIITFFKQMISPFFWSSANGENIRYSNYIKNNPEYIKLLPKIKFINTNEFNTYGELFKSICEATGYRIFFNEKDELIIDNDIFENVFLPTEISSIQDTLDLFTITGNFNPNLTINKVTSNNKTRIPLFDNSVFEDDSTPIQTRGMILNYKYCLSYDYVTKTATFPDENSLIKTISGIRINKISFNLLTKIDENNIDSKYGFNNILRISVPSIYFNYFKANYNDTVVAVYLGIDLIQYQFYGKIIDFEVLLDKNNIQANEKTIISIGFGYDVNYEDYTEVNGGYIDYLLTRNFDDLLEFSLFFGAEQLPIMYQYAKENNGKTYCNSIRYPIIPYNIDLDETSITGSSYSIYVEFSAPENKSFQYAGFVKDLDQYVGEYVINPTSPKKSLSNICKMGEFNFIQQIPQTDNYRSLIQMQLNLISIPTTGKEDNTLFKYDYTNNLSNIVLKVEKKNYNQTLLSLEEKNKKYDLKITIINKAQPTEDSIVDNVQILDILSPIYIRIDETTYNKIYSGCVMMMKKVQSNNDFYTLYNNIKNIKYTVLVKEKKQITFTPDPITYEYYIIIDKDFPTEKIDSLVPLNQHAIVKFFTSEIYHLNYLTIRANPIVELNENLIMENISSIEEFKENIYEINGSIIDRDYFLNIGKYLINESQIIDSDKKEDIRYRKYVVQGNINKRFDLDVLDRVMVTETNFLKLENTPFIIVGKDISVSDKNSVESLTLVNTNMTKTWYNDYEFTKDVLQNTFKPIGLSSPANYLSIDQIKTNKKISEDIVIGKNGVTKCTFTQLKNATIVGKTITAEITSNTNSNPSRLDIIPIKKNEKVLLIIGEVYVTAISNYQIGLTHEQASNFLSHEKLYENEGCRYRIENNPVVAPSTPPADPEIIPGQVSFKIYEIGKLNDKENTILPSKADEILLYQFYTIDMINNFVSSDQINVEQQKRVSGSYYNKFKININPYMSIKIKNETENQIIQLDDIRISNISCSIYKDKDIASAASISSKIVPGVAFNTFELDSILTSITTIETYSTYLSLLQNLNENNNVFIYFIPTYNIEVSYRYIFSFTYNSVVYYVSSIPSTNTAYLEDTKNSNVAYCSTNEEFNGALDTNTQFFGDLIYSAVDIENYYGLTFSFTNMPTNELNGFQFCIGNYSKGTAPRVSWNESKLITIHGDFITDSPTKTTSAQIQIALKNNRLPSFMKYINVENEISTISLPIIPSIAIVVTSIGTTPIVENPFYLQNISEIILTTPDTNKKLEHTDILGNLISDLDSVEVAGGIVFNTQNSLLTDLSRIIVDSDEMCYYKTSPSTGLNWYFGEHKDLTQFINPVYPNPQKYVYLKTPIYSFMTGITIPKNISKISAQFSETSIKSNLDIILSAPIIFSNLRIETTTINRKIEINADNILFDNVKFNGYSILGTKLGKATNCIFETNIDKFYCISLENIEKSKLYYTHNQEPIIGNYIFQNCINANNIEIETSLPSDYNLYPNKFGFFYECSNISNIIITGNYINAFKNCTNISKVKINNIPFSQTETLYRYASDYLFDNCSNITTITNNNSINYGTVFKDCNIISEVYYVFKRYISIALNCSQLNNIKIIQTDGANQITPYYPDILWYFTNCDQINNISIELNSVINITDTQSSIPYSKDCSNVVNNIITNIEKNGIYHVNLTSDTNNTWNHMSNKVLNKGSSSSAYTDIIQSAHNYDNVTKMATIIFGETEDIGYFHEEKQILEFYPKIANSGPSTLSINEETLDMIPNGDPIPIYKNGYLQLSTNDLLANGSYLLKYCRKPTSPYAEYYELLNPSCSNSTSSWIQDISTTTNLIELEGVDLSDYIVGTRYTVKVAQNNSGSVQIKYSTTLPSLPIIKGTNENYLYEVDIKTGYFIDVILISVFHLQTELYFWQMLNVSRTTKFINILNDSSSITPEWLEGNEFYQLDLTTTGIRTLNTPANPILGSQMQILITQSVAPANKTDFIFAAGYKFPNKADNEETYLSTIPATDLLSITYFGSNIFLCTLLKDFGRV